MAGKLRITILAVLMMLVAQPAMAGGWTGGREILRIYPNPAANGSFIIQDVMVNPDNCPLDDFYVLNKTNSNFDEIFALALAARVSGMVINFHVSGCFAQRPLITLAQL